MTAPALAARLGAVGSPPPDGQPDEAVDAFVDETVHLIRSQFAGIVGNLALVAPLVLGVQALCWWGQGKDDPEWLRRGRMYPIDRSFSPGFGRFRFFGLWLWFGLWLLYGPGLLGFSFRHTNTGSLGDLSRLAVTCLRGGWRS